MADRYTFKPGVFSYSGFGWGNYFDAQSKSHNCTRTEAQERAKAEGIPFVSIDTLEMSSGYTHNWREYTIPVPAPEPVESAYVKAAQTAGREIKMAGTTKQDDYNLGYRHGSDSEVPKTLGVWDRESYFAGYIAGVTDRDERLNRGEGHVVIPEWMTPKQVEAVNKLYARSPDGSVDRHAFFSRVQQHGVSCDRYAGITWCGMYVGIESDGYTHS